MSAITDLAGTRWARAIALAGVMLLVGCPKQEPARPAAPLGSGQQVTVATTAATNAATATADAETERLAKLRANVDAAASAPNIEASPVAQNELTVAQGRLADVQPDAAEVAAAAERRALVEAGRAEEARQNAVSAAEQGRKDAAELTVLRGEAARLALERDKLATELLAQAERNRIENQKAIDSALEAAKKAQDEQKNSMLQKQSEKLTWIGISCISAAISAAVGIGIFGSLLVLRKLAVYLVALAGVGFLFLGAAQIVSQPWFMWVCAGVILFGAIWAAVWAWRHQRRGDLEQELRARAEKIATVARTTVPILDEAYENAEAPIKEWLDRNVFNRLSDVMKKTPEVKTTVHEIRAGK